MNDSPAWQSVLQALPPSLCAPAAATAAEPATEPATAAGAIEAVTAVVD